MDRTQILQILAGLALVLTATASPAQQLIPARFGNTDNSLSKVLSMPGNIDTGDKVVRIPCQAIVEVSGEVRDVNCFTDMGENGPYVMEILRAAKNGSISPALVDGVPTRIFMTFSVWFACNEGECNVLALPHDNIHTAEFGLNYFAPQAIVSDDLWYEGFGEKLRTIRDRALSSTEDKERIAGRSARIGRTAPPGSVAYILSVEVDENGEASKGKVKRSIGPLEEVAELAGKTIAGNSFIPGYRDGKPAAMVYQEYGVVDLIPGEDDEMENFDSSSVMWDRPTF
jgi:hypothetical protein